MVKFIILLMCVLSFVFAYVKMTLALKFFLFYTMKCRLEAQKLSFCFEET